MLSQVSFFNLYIQQVHTLSPANLPPSLITILVSPKVYKVGSAIKADFSRLRRQFPQLAEYASFNLIDLKEFCIQQGVIERARAGSLDALVEKTTHKYLSKDETLRKCEDWEQHPLRQDLCLYAALDAYASQLVYQEALKRTPPARISGKTPPGTRVTLFTQNGGLPAAHGIISDPQPKSSFNGVRVNVPTNSRLLIDINDVVLPTAAATLHFVPGRRESRNKAGTYTLGELRSSGLLPSGAFRMVAPVNLLCHSESNDEAVSLSYLFDNGPF